MICRVRIKKAFYGNNPVLEDINFDLTEGKVLVIIGESGAGKSTLARIITGLWKFYPLRFEGEVDIDEEVDFIPQNVSDSLDPLFTIREQMKEITTNENSIEMVLKDVGFEDVDNILNSYPNNLSGGMKQRVLIAMSLLRSRIVVADEFTSALDSITKFKVTRLLNELVEKRGLSVIFITHDIELLKFDGDIMVIFDGRVVEKGKMVEVRNNPLHPYTKFLFSSIIKENMSYKSYKLPEIKIERGYGCPFVNSCDKVKEICKESKPPLKEMKGREIRCHF